MAERLRRAICGFAHFRDRLRDEQGQVLVIMTAAMTSLTLFTGAVIDIGIVMEERRQIQNAVDAASLAGARAARDNPGQAVAVAHQYLLLNGIDPADPDINVTINTVYGTNQVEITVSTAVPTAFLRVAGIDSKDVTVRAVGEALPLGAGNYAMVSLNETACNAFEVFGNPDLSITGGGIMVNSDCPAVAGDVYGNADVSADAIDYFVDGGFSVSQGGSVTPAPAPVNTRVLDPLAGALPAPTVGPSPDSGGTEASPAVRTINAGNVTLSEGIYWGGLNILGNANVTFNPGVYVIAKGDFESWGNGSISGAGVMIYLTGPNPADCGQISMYGNRVLDFTPASSGDYKDITFWQDQNCTADFQYHGNVTGVHGVIYAPGARFDLQGNTSLGGIQVISDTIRITGNANLNMTFTSYVGETSRGEISLAE